jgi:hypothetical protein
LIFWTSRRRVVAVIGIYSWVIASVTAIALIVSGPALAERSLTIYLLETLASVNEPMEKSQLEVATTKGWWPAYDQTAIRINEQLALGNIVRVEGQGYILTNRGKAFAKIAEIQAQIFSLNPKIVQGYSTLPSK